MFGAIFPFLSSLAGGAAGAGAASIASGAGAAGAAGSPPPLLFEGGGGAIDAAGTLGAAQAPKPPNFDLLRKALALSATSRNSRSAQSAQGALGFLNALDALNAPVKEGDIFEQAMQAIARAPKPAGGSQFPFMPGQSDTQFPGPPNEVGDGNMTISPGAGLIDVKNPVTQAQGPLAGLTAQQISSMMSAHALVQQGQSLQKMLKAKELQPTLIEAFMASRGAAPGLQYKQEARQNLRQTQLEVIKGLIQSGQGHLVQAFIEPMDPDAQRNLVQQHAQMMMTATAMQRAQAAPFIQTFRAGQEPAGTLRAEDMPPGLILPGQAQQAMALSKQRPPTPEEIQSRQGALFADPSSIPAALLGVHALYGKDAADMLRQQLAVSEEMRGRRDMAPILDKIKQKMGVGAALPGPSSQAQPPGAPPPSAPGVPGAPAPGTPPTAHVRAAQPSRRRPDLEQQVAVQATRAGLPAANVLGLIDVENNAWNPRINNAQYGRSGGMGLMQVVPSTWEAVLPRLGLDKPDEYNPEHNAAAGIAVLKELQGIYGNDWPRIFAAYQAGPGRIPKDGPIPETVTIQGPQGPVTVHPALYAAKVVRAAQARTQGEAQPTWTEPGNVPAQPLSQAQAAGQVPSGQVPSSQTSQLVAGEAAPGPGPTPAPVTPQGLIPGRGLPVLDPFDVDWTQGITLGPKGIQSINPHEAHQRSADLYIDTQMSKDPRLLPFALQAAQKAGAIPSPQRLDYYRQVYSTGAMMAALADPSIAAIPDYNQRFQAAIMQAGRGSAGLFKPELVEKFRDPVEQERSLAIMKRHETVTGAPEAQGGTPITAETAAQVEARRAGARASQERAGGVRGEMEERQHLTYGTQAQGTQAQGAQAQGQPFVPTLRIADPQDYRRYYNTETGQPLTGQEPMPQVMKGERERTVAKLDQKAVNDLNQLRSAASSLQVVFSHYEKIYGPGGIYEKIQAGLFPRLAAGVKGLSAVVQQTDAELVSAIRRSTLVARQALQTVGESGKISDKDVAQAMDTIPKLSFPLPDSPKVARELISDMVKLHNKMTGAILDNPKFEDTRYMRMPLILGGPVTLPAEGR